MVAGGGGRSPFQITLRASQRRWLKALVRRGTAEYRQLTRARIVLLAAAGWTNRRIARKLGLAPNTASKWRKRFYQEGVDGLGDRKRPGRPRAFPAAVVTACKAIACELPATRGVPLGRWSLAELRTEVLATGLINDVSTTTLWRWLAEDPIKPWQHRSWIFPRDPHFAAKAGVVLDLYDRVFQDQELEPDAYVVSADEKTSIQARCRCHPTLPPAAARAMRIEHEYERGGALAYLAAWDVHQARLFGRCKPSTGIQPFGRLVEQVKTTESYASATRVFWIVWSAQWADPCVFVWLASCLVTLAVCLMSGMADTWPAWERCWSHLSRRPVAHLQQAVGERVPQPPSIDASGSSEA